MIQQHEGSFDFANSWACWRSMVSSHMKKIVQRADIWSVARVISTRKFC